MGSRHVPAIHPAQEERKDARLLEHRREQASRHGRVVQRQVLYLGEINSSQLVAWRCAIGVIDETTGKTHTLALFPDDHSLVATDADTLQVRLSEMRPCRPRQWGACWLAGQLWRELELDRFWAERRHGAASGRDGT